MVHRLWVDCLNLATKWNTKWSLCWLLVKDIGIHVICNQFLYWEWEKDMCPKIWEILYNRFRRTCRPLFFGFQLFPILATMGLVTLVPLICVVVLIHGLRNGRKLKSKKSGDTRFPQSPVASPRYVFFLKHINIFLGKLYFFLDWGSILEPKDFRNFSSILASLTVSSGFLCLQACLETQQGGLGLWFGNDYTYRSCFVPFELSEIKTKTQSVDVLVQCRWRRHK